MAKMTLQIDVQIPDIPNALRVIVPGATESSERVFISLGLFDDQTLRAVGQAWTEALLAKAASDRASIPA